MVVSSSLTESSTFANVVEREPRPPYDKSLLSTEGWVSLLTLSYVLLQTGMPGFDSVAVVKQACSVSLTHFNQKAKLLVGNDYFRVAA